MPFRTTQTLPASPSVKVFLSGLLILIPNDDGSACDIGVHRRSPEHYLSIEARAKMLDDAEGPVPDIILMRRLGPLEPTRFTIDVEPATIEGVRKFIPPHGFDRANRDTNPNDFRWIIDLASTEFHGQTLDTEEFGIKPDIRVKDGVFYTAKRTDDTKVRVTRTGGGQNSLPLYRIASIIGVNIYLNDNSKLALSWTDSTLPPPQPQTLKLDKPDNASGIDHYEIYISNDPPFVDPTKNATHIEFNEYYKVAEPPLKVVGGVPIIEKFDVVFEKIDQPIQPPQPPSLGTPTIPCMPISNGS